MATINLWYIDMGDKLVIIISLFIIGFAVILALITAIYNYRKEKKYLKERREKVSKMLDSIDLKR